MPKITDPNYILKRETNKSILVSLKIETLDLLKTVIPNYQRSKLIQQLLDEYLKKHLQDAVLENYSKNGHKKNKTTKDLDEGVLSSSNQIKSKKK